MMLEALKCSISYFKVYYILFKICVMTQALAIWEREREVYYVQIFNDTVVGKIFSDNGIVIVMYNIIYLPKKELQHVI